MFKTNQVALARTKYKMKDIQVRMHKKIEKGIGKGKQLL